MARLFKAGDTVVLKSGSPVMKVIKYIEEDGLLGKEVSDRKVQCVWYDPNDGRKKEVFHQNMLIHASKTFSLDYKNTSTLYGSFKNAMELMTKEEAQGTFNELSTAIYFLIAKGFTKQFLPEKEYLISLPDGDKYKPEEMSIIRVFQFEGFTDIDDMSVLYAIETEDGTKGWIANAQGLYENNDLKSLLTRMKTKQLQQL
jgi:uncharacterized protein YodC (DUF2158 family)